MALELSSSAAPDPPGAKSDGSSTTPACDQCRSRKIRCNRETPECLNCRKAGVSCEFSNRGKRVNHTRQLIEDFSSLGARLDSIDQTLANLTQAFSSTDQTSRSASHASEVDDLDLFVRRQDSGNSDQDTTTSQQVTALATKVPSLRTELQNLYDSFPFVNSCREPNFSSDGNPVSSPPRSFIHTVVDCFLSNINSTRPIFQESKLKSAIEHNDSGQVSESMEGRDLCFSNIILLTLDLKSRLARRSHTKSNGMDEDLLMSFWKNSQRAFGHLPTYLEPRLVNVQALTTLAMVAREYCENQVFERLCHMACLVAKSMGLHRLSSKSNGAMTEEEAERTELFWALYVMDKERVFMTGQPCDLYFFDTDLQLLECDTECTPQHFTVAHNHLMSLWEEIYISLYSSGARRKGSPRRFKQVTKLSELFRNWVCKYKVLLKTPLTVDASTNDCFRLELKYCFHVGQILIHRCGREETSKQQRINSVYSALKIIKEIHESSSSISNVALLGRIFRCYPSVAFLELHTRILEDPNKRSKADIELLTTVAEALNTLKNPNFPQAYYSRLHIGMLWCIRVVSTVINAMDQSSPRATPVVPAGRCEPIAPESTRPQKPPSLSNSSLPASSSSKTTHTLCQDESTRPRKRPAVPQSAVSSQPPSRAAPHAQRATAGSSVPNAARNCSGIRAFASLGGEEDAVDPVSASRLSGDYQDWSPPPFNHDIAGAPACVTLPKTSSLGGTYFEAGSLDDYLLSGGSVMEPWEMDLTDETILDGGGQSKEFDGWVN